MCTEQRHGVREMLRAGVWGMRSAERRKVNVLEMKCLRNLVGVSRMDRVRNEEVSRRRIERELTWPTHL